MVGSRLMTRLKSPGCFLRVAAVKQKRPPGEVRLGVVRSALDDLVQVGQGLILAVHADEQGGPVIPGVDHAGIYVQGFVEVGEGGIGVQEIAVVKELHGLAQGVGGLGFPLIGRFLLRRGRRRDLACAGRDDQEKKGKQYQGERAHG